MPKFSSADLQAMSQQTKNQLMIMFGKYLIEIQKDTVDGSKLGNQTTKSYKERGYSFFKMLEQLQKTSLDRWSMEQLILAIAGILSILKFEHPVEEVLNEYFSDFLLAYTVAVGYTSNKSLETLYSVTRTLESTTNRYDRDLLIDDEFISGVEHMTAREKKKALKQAQKQAKNKQQENED